MEKLRKSQEETSGKAREEETSLREKKALYDGELRELAERYREAAGDAGAAAVGEAEQEAETVHTLVGSFLKKVRAEGAVLRENADRLKKVQKELEDAGKEREKLRQSAETGEPFGQDGVFRNGGSPKSAQGGSGEAKRCESALSGSAE